MLPPPLPWQTPGHLTFLKNFGQIPWYVGSWDGQMPHWLALRTTHQWLFKFFPHVKKHLFKCKYPTKYMLLKYLKFWKAVLRRFVHLNKIVHSTKPTFDRLFQRLKCSNKTVNIGEITHEHGAHAEWKNYEILWLEKLTGFLTWKSNVPLGGPHFRSKSLL